MAKKDYKTGMAGLLTPTAPEMKKEGVTAAGGSVAGVSAGTIGTTGTEGTSGTEGLYVSVPVSLKRRMDVYCAEHKVKKHVFIADAIEKFLGV